MKTATFRGLRTALPPCNYASNAITIEPLIFQRWASSPAKSIPPTYEKPRSLLNGPPSTLPAPITLPPRDPSLSTFKYVFRTGKAYLSFYKTGVKNIYTNFFSAQPIQNRIDKSYNFDLRAAVDANALTRSEFLLLHRSNHDIKRVPAFGLVFLICGEFTPLVVLAVSNIVPWTCRIPRQIEGDRRKLEERRRVSFRNLTMTPPEAESGSKSVIDGLERQQLIHISWSLGLSSSIWDYLGGQYPGLPDFVLKRRARKRVVYLEMDDKLLGNGDRVRELEDEEVRMACVERGIDVSNRPIQNLRDDLKAWLGSRSTNRSSVERLLLTRPSIWPVRPKYTTETK